MDVSRKLGILVFFGVPAIIGGGIIGLEMATVYHALGSEITVVEFMDTIIPGCDKDIVRPLLKTAMTGLIKRILPNEISFFIN